MSNIYTTNMPITTSKKINNYNLAIVNETLDIRGSVNSIKKILPDCQFEPKKSTLEAILAYSRKK